MRCWIIQKQGMQGDTQCDPCSCINWHPIMSTSMSIHNYTVSYVTLTDYKNQWLSQHWYIIYSFNIIIFYSMTMLSNSDQHTCNCRHIPGFYHVVMESISNFCYAFLDNPYSQWSHKFHLRESKYIWTDWSNSQHQCSDHCPTIYTMLVYQPVQLILEWLQLVLSMRYTQHVLSVHCVSQLSRMVACSLEYMQQRLSTWLGNEGMTRHTVALIWNPVSNPYLYYYTIHYKPDEMTQKFQEEETSQWWIASSCAPSRQFLCCDRRTGEGNKLPVLHQCN